MMMNLHSNSCTHTHTHMMPNKCFYFVLFFQSLFFLLLHQVDSKPRPIDHPSNLLDLIEPVYCHNGGFFVDNKCVCRQGFYGEYCESSFIGDNEMIPTPESPMKQFLIKNAFSCDQLFCQHESECVNSFDNGYYCKCRLGFRGNLCEQGKPDVVHMTIS